MKNYEMYLSKNYPRNTVISYLNRLQCFVRFTNKPLDKITKSDIINYFEKNKNLKNSSLRLTKYALNHYFKFTNNDLKCDYYIPPTKSNKMKSLSKTTVDSLIKNVKYNSEYETLRNKTIIKMLYSFGLRIDECRNIKESDINLVNQTLIVNGKGSKRRVIPIPKYMMNYLIQYINFTKKHFSLLTLNFIFLTNGKNNKGKQISYGAFRHLIKKILTDNDLDYRPYIFRKTFATHLVKNGVNLDTISTLMGHSNVKSLFDYASLEIIDDKEALSSLA